MDDLHDDPFRSVGPRAEHIARALYWYRTALENLEAVLRSEDADWISHGGFDALSAVRAANGDLAMACLVHRGDIDPGICDAAQARAGIDGAITVLHLQCQMSDAHGSSMLQEFLDRLRRALHESEPLLAALADGRGTDAAREQAVAELLERARLAEEREARLRTANNQLQSQLLQLSRQLHPSRQGRGA